jgi:hypothetical protein
MTRKMTVWLRLLAMAAAGPAMGAITQMAATVQDGATGDLLAQGGPWPVGAASYVVDGIPVGADRSLRIDGLNDAGTAVATGTLTGLSVGAASPLDATGMLELVPVDGGVSVRDADGMELGVIPLVEAGGPLEVAVDIKPGSDRNPFHPKACGVVPVAILGGPDLDVTRIDVATLTLAGVPPVRAHVADIEVLETGELLPDGFADLVLFFRAPDLAVALGQVTRGQTVPLLLEGALNDGTAIAGSDTITVVGKPTPKKPHPAGRKAK